MRWLIVIVDWILWLLRRSAVCCMMKQSLVRFILLHKDIRLWIKLWERFFAFERWRERSLTKEVSFSQKRMNVSVRMMTNKMQILLMIVTKKLCSWFKVWIHEKTEDYHSEVEDSLYFFFLMISCRSVVYWFNKRNPGSGLSGEIVSEIDLIS